MRSRIERFREDVARAARDPGFIHHRWFVRYHLAIVERLALELCAIYPHADKNMVLVLVWLHDYGKILDRANEHEATLRAGRENVDKALVDWRRKVVLPEVRAAFAGRHRLLLEHCGHFPPTFLGLDERLAADGRIIGLPEMTEG